jgi:hypothetical protein|tara:strand:- start:49 stop:336 length:288 start_codon:yes stop_codon:yes gene_type:complete
MTSEETANNLSWSGVNVTVSDEWIAEFKIAADMQQNKAFRNYRVTRVLELAQRQVDDLEANKDSDEFMQMLSWYIGELYCWQEEGEVVEPPVQTN